MTSSPADPLPFPVHDYADGPPEPEPERLPDEFGRDLPTVERARRWLSNPAAWFESELAIMRWDGLVPRVSRRHGERLAREPWDDGLPWCAVVGQRERRARRDKGEPLEGAEPGPPPVED